MSIDVPARPYVRSDGKEKVTGSGRYPPTSPSPASCIAAFRYADHPHARILRIDTTAARAVPGARGDHPRGRPDVPVRRVALDRRLFARDKVRYEGDVVAAVAATSVEIARRAAALVEVEYEVLPRCPTTSRTVRPVPRWSTRTGRRTSSTRASAAAATCWATLTIVI